MTHNTREVEEKTDCELYDHFPVPYDVAFWHCKVCGKELYFDTIESLETHHQQLQKAREEERERYKKYLKYHYENYGIESLRELITTPLDHSELDHQPDRPLNQERE